MTWPDSIHGSCQPLGSITYITIIMEGLIVPPHLPSPPLLGGYRGRVEMTGQPAYDKDTCRQQRFYLPGVSHHHHCHSPAQDSTTPQCELGHTAGPKMVFEMGWRTLTTPAGHATASDVLSLASAHTHPLGQQNPDDQQGSKHRAEARRQERQKKRRTPGSKSGNSTLD
jgi:hypothetical protein